jgi:type IV pilus assembly protein PilQ
VDNVTRRWLIGALGLLWLTGPVAVYADPAEDAAETAPLDEAAVDAVEAPAASPGAAAGAPAPPAAEPSGLISVDFKDADIRQVLRIISLKSGVDIVAGTDVEGLVTIKLTAVPWEQALDIILRTYGFTYERKDKIVRVMTVEALEQEALRTEVFPLDYAKAKEVPDVLKEMLSDRGKVKFDERTNTIIVTDIPTNLFQIKEVIERLDQRTPQVLIQSRIVETRLTKEENLGIDWTSTLQTTWSHSIPDLTSSFPFPTGSSFGTIGQVFDLERVAERANANDTITLGTVTTPALTVVLNMLQRRTDTKILSNPSIAVLNNQEAKIHIGQEYPIPNYSIDPTTGNTTISGYEAKDVGTVLTVTPHVNPSSEIVVDLKPEIIAAEPSGVSYSTGGSNTNVTLPLFTTQTAKTQVRIASGETIVIGGLVKESSSHVQSKVPLLGDIPLVGALFKNNRWYSGGSDPNRQDLIIFLTVDLMEQEGEGRAEPAVASASGERGGY